MNSLSLHCRDLAFGYECEPEVIRVSRLDLLPGEIAVFYGGNGTGKTTLMKGLSGLLPPRNGSLEFRNGGESLDLNSGFALSLYMHQEPYILKGSVRQNLALFLAGLPRAERDERILRALGLAGLEGFEKKKAAALSGGEKKRLALARAMAGDREVLLLDEPTANVDARNIELLMENLQTFRKAGRTIIVATHDRNFARRMADKVYEFVRGTLSFQEDFRAGGNPEC